MLGHVHGDCFSGKLQIEILFSEVQMQLLLFFIRQLPQIVMTAGVADRVDILRRDSFKVFRH